MKYAKKRCRKFQMGQVPYYPGLTYMAMTLIFWRLMKRYRVQDQINAIWISERLTATKITFLPFFFSIDDHEEL